MTLTAALHWTPLSLAITTTLHCRTSPITDLNWSDTVTLTTAALSDTYPAVAPYSGRTLYFVLKLQDDIGPRLGLSNSALWLFHAVYLPVIRHLRRGLPRTEYGLACLGRLSPSGAQPHDRLLMGTLPELEAKRPLNRYRASFSGVSGLSPLWSPVADPLILARQGGLM